MGGVGFGVRWHSCLLTWVMRATKLLCGILLLKNVLFSLSEDMTELQV
jgi:hypothetical protein